MQTRIRKWGNSLAIRIPKLFATEAELDQDMLVELALEEGRVTITPLNEPGPTLDDLLAGITDENLHREIDVGPPVGDEAW